MVNFYFFGLFVLQLIVACLSRQNNSSVVHESPKKRIQYIKDDYDKTTIPNISGGSPLNVKIDIYVTTMEPIDQINMKFTLQMYLRQYWKDESLQFKFSNDSCTGDYVSLHPDIIPKVWIPDTYIKNEVSRDVRSRALVIWANGLVLLSERVNIKAYCPLNLRRYPIDVQECTLKFQSYSYPACLLQYSWFYEGESLRLEKSIDLPNYDITALRTYIETDNLKTGSFSRVLANFQFTRKIMYILMRDYLPAAFIVATSWLSFHINPAASPARVSLAVVTVLSISTQLSSTFKSAPEVSYIKAMDWYLIGCFLFVFAAMVEYGFIHNYGDVTVGTCTSNTQSKYAGHAGTVNAAFEEVENEEARATSNDGVYIHSGDGLSQYCTNYRSNITANFRLQNNDAQYFNDEDRSRKEKEKKNCFWTRLVIRYRGIPCADAISGIAFPILFLTFNVIYWILIFLT